MRKNKHCWILKFWKLWVIQSWKQMETTGRQEWSQLIHATDAQLLHILYELTPADIPTGILLSYSETMVMKTSCGNLGSLFIFSLQHPGFCNLTSTHGIWQGVLLVNLERQSDCRRTVVELRYQCGSGSAPSWHRRRPPQILPAAAAAKAALVPVQLRRNLSNLWKYELVFFVNFHRMSIEKP